MFLILPHSTLKTIIVWHNGWHTMAGIVLTGKKSYCLEEGEGVGDGRTKGSSAMREGKLQFHSCPALVEGTFESVHMQRTSDPWRKEWQSIPIFLPGEFHIQWSLEGYSPGDHKASDTIEQPTISLYCNTYSMGYWMDWGKLNMYCNP